MKVDDKYLRTLLEAFESIDTPDVDIRALEAAGVDVTQPSFLFHMEHLNETGAVIRADKRDGIGYVRGIGGASWTVVPLRITANGHNLLRRLRSMPNATSRPAVARAGAHPPLPSNLVATSPKPAPLPLAPSARSQGHDLVPYLRELVQEMATTMNAIGTFSRSLQSSGVSEEYAQLHRRMVAMSVLTGPLPAWFLSASDGWKFWNDALGGVALSPPKLRDFVDEEFRAPMLAAIGDEHEPVDRAAAMLRRGLVLEGEIGTGGFGSVEMAYHLALDTHRAVKFFAPRFYTGGQGELRRYAREAKLLARLNHPGIVRFFDAGIAGGHPFLITELVDGEDLYKQLNETFDAGLKPSEVQSICDQLLEGLGYAHSVGVFHRDIKPRNLIWHKGKLTILDFGAGNFLEQELTTRMTTHAVGTLGYIAPELQDDPTILDPRVDLYSVAVLAHQLLTKLTIQPGDPRYVLHENGVNSALAEWIVKGIQPIANRFATAVAMRQALLAIDLAPP